MATTIYNEPWSPSEINCNWKPEKLSRYSFVTNLINFNATDIALNKYQSYSNNLYELLSSPNFHTTGYIAVSPFTSYQFICEENIVEGVYDIFYFNSSKGYLGSTHYYVYDNSSKKSFFDTPANCVYIRITLYKDAWGKCTLRKSYSPSLSEKDRTPLKIIDNKEGTQIYKDLHFEVYVKAEALIKNFVDCFDLSAFQAFPNDPSLFYYNQNSLILNYQTRDYYKNTYPNTFPNFQPNYAYLVGDFITGSLFPSFSQRYVCLKAHTSAASFSEDYWNEDTYTLTGNWGNIANPLDWLYVDKSIKEINYSEEIGFPYVGSLVFKNLWGCDMINYLNTYVNKSYLAISYYDLFAKNLRMANPYYYDKFFQQGYFSDIDLNGNTSNVEGFGVRLIRGENFRNDEILGDTILNNYFNFIETRHAVSSSWNANSDSTNNTYFNGSIHKPFDHWYRFEPTRSIPFFKEKVFEDFKIELVLQREDVLGNLFQRIVNLPILVTFTNNLIKCYFRNANLDGTPTYTSEFLNSNAVNSFYYDHKEGSSGVLSKVVIWCPNVKRLTVSSTIFNPTRVKTFPKLININGNSESPLEGQTCILTWSANELNVNEKVTAIHSLEYSDGENYDKFIFIEEITRRS